MIPTPSRPRPASEHRSPPCPNSTQGRLARQLEEAAWPYLAYVEQRWDSEQQPPGTEGARPSSRVSPGRAGGAGSAAGRASPMASLRPFSPSIRLRLSGTSSAATLPHAQANARPANRVIPVSWESRANARSTANCSSGGEPGSRSTVPTNSYPSSTPPASSYPLARPDTNSRQAEEGTESTTNGRRTTTGSNGGGPGSRSTVCSS